MFAEITGLMGGFQNFILCLVIGLLVVMVITLAGFSLFGFEHPFLGWYAMFLNDKRKRTIAFSVSLVRMLYLCALIGMARSFGLTHMLIYVLFTVILWGTILRLSYALYDLFYCAGVLGIVYLLSLMQKDLGKVQPRTGMMVLTVLFSLLLLIAAVGQFFVSINGIIPKSINKTERDIKVQKWSRMILPCLYVACIFPYLVLHHTDSITLEAGGIQFVNGEMITVAAGSKISDTDSGCMAANDTESFILADVPVYDSANDRVIFTEYCSVVQPKIQMINRVSPMCILENEGGTFRVVNGNRTSTIENFFFFDGNDAYYFPENTKLTWGEETVVLSSFSKVDVSFNQKIQIYNYRSGTYSVYEAVEGFCIATLQGSEQVNLSTDILYRANGDEQMLFMQPMLLNDLE